MAAQRRSAKKRSSSEEAEDAPLVVDEHGNSVDVRLDHDDGAAEETHPEEAAARVQDHGAKPSDESEKPGAQPKSSIGARKRRIGRVVGTDVADSPLGSGRGEKATTGETDAAADKKVKRKAKKIKLSFCEDEA